MKRWSHKKGGYIHVKGPDRPKPKTYEEHRVRYNNILGELIDSGRHSLGFPLSEIVRRFNRGAKAMGYGRARLIDGEVELG